MFVPSLDCPRQNLFRQNSPLNHSMLGPLLVSCLLIARLLFGRFLMGVSLDPHQVISSLVSAIPRCSRKLLPAPLHPESCSHMDWPSQPDARSSRRAVDHARTGLLDCSTLVFPRRLDQNHYRCPLLRSVLAHRIPVANDPNLFISGTLAVSTHAHPLTAPHIRCTAIAISVRSCLCSGRSLSLDRPNERSQCGAGLGRL